MSDLIDRQAVLSVIRMAMPEETSRYLLYQSVKQLPEVDAVRVIRCKDCSNFRTRTDGSVYCYNDMSIGNKNDYCSYGERKDNDIR